MDKWAVDVRYPGAPTTLEASEGSEHVGSMTISAPHHTTLHMQVEGTDVHDAMTIAQVHADRVARSMGLDVRHAITSALQPKGEAA